MFDVLFLCTGNSARSIMAEALLTRWGEGRFRAYSAGSHPTGQVHPVALELLRRFDFPVTDLRSKHWHEFAGEGAAALDFVFTVCDRAANEPCPVWPGQPMTAHWGVADPAAAAGDELVVMQAFRRAFSELEHRIGLFVALPFESLDSLRLRDELTRIGQSLPDDSSAA